MNIQMRFDAILANSFSTCIMVKAIDSEFDPLFCKNEVVCYNMNTK